MKISKASSRCDGFYEIRQSNREVGIEIIHGLRERCPNGVAQFHLRAYKAGEHVMVKEGPFSGLEAVFEREIKGSEQVRHTS